MQDVDGCTPIVWAVHNNHFQNAKMLIDAGADVTLKDVKGRVAKDHAMSSKMRSLFLAPGEVADSGVGISADDQAVLFERFAVGSSINRAAESGMKNPCGRATSAQKVKMKYPRRQLVAHIKKCMDLFHKIIGN